METSLLWNASLLKHTGMQLLTQHLGLAEFERFIALVRRELPLDYTEWRLNLFDDMTADELFDTVSKHRTEQ
jgi:hypothetical protein